MMLTLVQIFSFFCAFIGLGKSIDKRDKVADRVLGFIICLVFLVLILYIEVVLKR